MLDSTFGEKGVEGHQMEELRSKISEANLHSLGQKQA